MKRLTSRVLLALFVLPGLLFAQSPPTGLDKTPPLYVKVQLDNSVKLSALKPGDVTEGNLARDVYSADRKVFPAGSRVRLTVDHLERTRRTNSGWPWVAQLFMPRHENLPAFRDATIAVPDGSESLLQVTLISTARRNEIRPHPSKRMKSAEAAIETSRSTSNRTGDSPAYNKSLLGPIMSLEAQPENALPYTERHSSTLTDLSASSTLPAGTACRVLLLNGVSASKSHAGDVIQARLLEPVELGSHVVLPAGAVFTGTVQKASRPHILSRAGSLSLTFTEVRLPDGTQVPVSGSLTALELNRGSHTKIDAEGRLRGERPGLMWMLINGGVTASIAKEVDDGAQLIIEAIVSSATDASTAGTARIVGAAVSGVFMLTRRGRDVVIPSQTEMSITLNRPVTLSSAQGPHNP